jgi:type I restriction enzyme S subunit
MNDDARKTLTPKLRFPEFVREVWRDVRLQDVTAECTTRNGDKLTPESVMGVMKVDGMIPMKERLIGPDISRYKLVRKNWFAYNPMRINIGSIARWKNDSDVLVSPDYVVFRCLEQSTSAIDPEYLDHFRRSDKWEDFVTEAGGGSVRVRIYFKDLAALQLKLPPLAEQQKIADCLTSLDEVIAAQGRKVAALKAHKKGLMQQLFPREGETLPRLRFPEFREAPDKVTLGEVVEIASGQVDPTKPPYCDLPHIGSENIESHSGTLRDVTTARELRIISGNYLFDERDVLYSKIRPALNKVAAPGFKGTCSADIYPLRPSNRQLCREYLAYLLQSDPFLEYATKQSSRSKIPKINREGLLAYEVQLLAVAEQHRIAACLSSLDARIAAESEKLSALKTHKKGLMQQLFPSPEGE